MRSAIDRHHGILRGAAGLALLLGVALLLRHVPLLINSAFGSPKSSDAQAQVTSITNAVSAVCGDALPFMLAVAPLSVLIGMCALFVGNRRGVSIISSGLGALIVVAALNGIAK